MIHHRMGLKCKMLMKCLPNVVFDSKELLEIFKQRIKIVGKMLNHCDVSLNNNVESPRKIVTFPTQSQFKTSQGYVHIHQHKFHRKQTNKLTWGIKKCVVSPKQRLISQKMMPFLNVEICVLMTAWMDRLFRFRRRTDSRLHFQR